MKKYLKKAPIVLFGLSAIGILDAIYLTYEHYHVLGVACFTLGIIDCGKVIRGSYSEMFGIPLSVYGLLYYLSISASAAILIFIKNLRLIKYYVLLSSSFAFLFSLYLVYLQLLVIGAICPYCMLSALLSTILFFASINYFSEERKRFAVSKAAWLYKNIIKSVFFLIDAETVHEGMLSFGQLLGKSIFVRKITEYLLLWDDKALSQKLMGINFRRPVGMAAGFDYQAKLTQFLPSLGFGFATAGTITNIPYEGNPKPRLGRLPNSRSLLVNKGFRNEGADNIAKRLSKLKYEYAQGISIGRSNSKILVNQRKSIRDIISAFKKFEKEKVRNSYYELNISCPNLIHGKASFYTPDKLNQLLVAVDKLKLKKPLLIKMPIELTNRQVFLLLGVVAKHSPAGLIFGNLQKDSKHPLLDKKEVKKYKMGYFSGKPTYERSNELIRLTYKKYKERFVIVGCGGVFSAEDAYTKIRLGASLVQLITGLIYEGPQLVAEINFGLYDLLRRDGYKNIREAVGVDVR
jgi:dihydroorotate dehydrogenase